MVKRAVLMCTLALLPPAAYVETAYVTDLLALGLHQADDASDPAFAELASGTELEILERTVSHARVRARDGREGWVEAAYLVSAKPAQLRIVEAQAQLARLAQENAGYERQLEAYRNALPRAWVMAALGFAAAAGFAAGWWWLDRSIRRRHGGFRIG